MDFLFSFLFLCFVLCLLISYFIGSIPFGLLLTRLFGYGDIRKVGSGNIGATNVLRTGNKWLALGTLLCDFIKGFLPCFFIYLHWGKSCGDFCFLAFIYMNIAVFGTILGHIFPVWLKFKGGKGVATALGAMVALHYPLGLVAIGVWLLTFFVSRFSSLSALVAFVAATVAAAFMWPYAQAAFFENIYFDDMCAITAIIFFTHRENIRRLIKGEEHKWSRK